MKLLQLDSSMSSRWIGSTNARDIGTSYLMYALGSGLAGTAASVIIRMELSAPGNGILAGNHQLYNSIVTIHGLLMIFFLVNKKNTPALKNFTRRGSCDFITSKSCFNTSTKRHFSIHTRWANNHNSSVNVKMGQPDNIPITINRPYNKIIMENPYENRKLLVKLVKNEKGIYIFEDLLTGSILYVGHSINLYNRISSYFMPSILQSEERKVLQYFHKHTFSNVRLHIYVVNSSIDIIDLIELEQKFLDLLKPKLNVNLIAKGLKSHFPMSEQAKLNLRKTRGTSVYIYRVEQFTRDLLYRFYSKQELYNLLKMNHSTLTCLLQEGGLYLNLLFFSLDPLSEEDTDPMFTSVEFIDYIFKIRQSYKSTYQQKGTKIFAENIKNVKLSKHYASIHQLAKALKGDRTTIKKYIADKGTKLYRGQWKFHQS